MSHHNIPAARREALRSSLQATADALHRRKASEISADWIEDNVSLNWLEWWASSLRLTTTGQNVCRQMCDLANWTAEAVPTGGCPMYRTCTDVGFMGNWTGIGICLP